jgi:hypothetical protein
VLPQRVALPAPSYSWAPVSWLAELNVAVSVVPSMVALVRLPLAS